MIDKVNRNELVRAVVIQFCNDESEQSLIETCKLISKKTGYLTDYVHAGSKHAIQNKNL